MEKLEHFEIIIFLIQLIGLLGISKFFGELARRLKQPAVIGEIIGGIIIGPTIIGTFAPSLFHSLFINSVGSAVALDGLITVSVIFLLFVVGLEIELDSIKKQGKAVTYLGILGVAIPFVLGYPVGWGLFPLVDTNLTRHVYSLFIGAALSISALPVIARVLLDLNLLKTKIGNLIAAVATINDIVGWLIFTLVLGLSASGGKELNLGTTIAITLLLAVLSVTILRKIMNWLLEKVSIIFPGPGGIIGLLIVLMFGAGLYTEYLGIHAVFGALLIGIAVNGSSRITHQIKESINIFTTHILAPLFFAAVGLKVNFFSSFDIRIVLIVLIAAYATKMLAGWLGGKLAGLDKNERLAVGIGITARGGMGVILAIIAFDTHIIGPKMFEALVVMALVTSVTSGLIKKYIKPNENPSIENKSLQ